jgi:anti-sigma factor RsiW
MENEYAHPSNEELLLFADGELSTRRVSQINAHLAACWDCRIRLKQLEQAIADFVCAYHGSLDPRLPSSAGPRALLKARMSQPPATVRHSPWLRPFQQAFTERRFAYLGAMLLIAALGMMVGYGSLLSTTSALSVFRWTAKPVPNRRLTPGATRPVSTSEVCTVRYSDDASLVPASVREKVYRAYGMTGSQAKDYQLDYLVSPQLGGTDDIRNLWPEPASPSGWNMQVKDELEDRLHQLVCQGKINLATAQSDLATDWISAYKRYFRTDRPIEPL